MQRHAIFFWLIFVLSQVKAGFHIIIRSLKTIAVSLRSSSNSLRSHGSTNFRTSQTVANCLRSSYDRLKKVEHVQLLRLLMTAYDSLRLYGNTNLVSSPTVCVISIVKNYSRSHHCPIRTITFQHNSRGS